MTFRTIEDKRLGEKLCYAKHSSGLNVYFCPKPGLSQIFAMFGTRFGSIDNMFRLAGEQEFTKLPDGTAHFMEHKLFENEDGADVFTEFGKLGAFCNAYTSFDRTVYEFYCTENFPEALGLLLNFVQSPYFTPETVKKEQGIIGQEIKMYEDNPGWRVYFNLIGALYQNHPVRIDIAGTVDSISEINDKLLYRCFNVFYNLSNMVLCISGNTTEEEISKVLDEMLKPSKSVEIERAYPQEPLSVNQPIVTQKLSVSIPHFNIGIKGSENNVSGERFAKRDAVMSVLTEILAGKSAAFYKLLYDEGLINDTFSAEFMASKDFSLTIFTGESEKPQELFSRIKEEIRRLRHEKVDEETFQQTLRAAYGKFISSLDRTEGVVNSMIAAYFNGINLFDIYYAYERITLADINEALEDWTEDKMAISIIEPME